MSFSYVKTLFSFSSKTFSKSTLNRCMKSYHYHCFSTSALFYSQFPVKFETLSCFCSYLQYLNNNVSKHGAVYLPTNLVEQFGGRNQKVADNIAFLNESLNKISAQCQEKNEIQNTFIKKKTVKNSEELELEELAKNDIQVLKNSILNSLNLLVHDLLSLQSIKPSLRNLNGIILEVYAGVGGQEAMLFASELFGMYQNMCEINGFRFDEEHNEKDGNGLCKGVATITCSNNNYLYSLLQHETGTHRVQRVPITERHGRVHTSTATVAVLPMPDKINIDIPAKDLKFTAYCKASGPGGQHVNKTQSAARFVHIPTGIIVENCSSRDLLANKERAFKVLKAKLFDKESTSQESSFKKQRKQQISNNARSDKIRTYNYHQDRITDHRLSKNVKGVQDFLSGSSLMDFMELMEEQQKYMELTITLEMLLKEGIGVFKKDWDSEIIQKSCQFKFK